MERPTMVYLLGSNRTIPWIRPLAYVLPLLISSLTPALAQTGDRAITITANSQEANSLTGVITAEGNVTIRYPAQSVVATADKAIYFTQEQRIELEGGVEVTQDQNRLQAEQIVYHVDEGTIQAIPTAGQQVESVYILPAPAQPVPEITPTP